jgi:hypothetical protein
MSRVPPTQQPLSFSSLISSATSHRLSKVPTSFQQATSTINTKFSCLISSMDNLSIFLRNYTPNSLKLEYKTYRGPSYPPDTEEKQKKLGAFFQGTGAPPKAVQKIPAIVEEIKKHNSNLKSFGIVGVRPFTSPPTISHPLTTSSYAGAAK